jgi:hypothetical protein
MKHMLAFKAADRLSLEELKGHPWFTEGDIPSKEEVFEAFKKRHEIN